MSHFIQIIAKKVLYEIVKRKMLSIFEAALLNNCHRRTASFSLNPYFQLLEKK